MALRILLGIALTEENEIMAMKVPTSRAESIRAWNRWAMDVFVTMWQAYITGMER